MDNQNKSINLITKIVMFLFIVLIVLLVIKFSSVAISGRSNSVNLETFFNNKYTRSKVVSAKRGNIYDRNGKPLAITLNDYKIYAIIDETYINRVTSFEMFSEKVSEVTDCDKSFFMNILDRNKGLFQVEFGQCGIIDLFQKQELESLDIDGLFFMNHYSRFYPNNNYLSHMIGYTNYENETLVGITGIEKQYDEILSGENGESKYLIDKYGDVLVGSEIVTEPMHGSDIYLTIDVAIQHMLEKEVVKVWEDTNPEAINATITNSNDGSILASISYPSFNLNEKDIMFHNDHVATISYEPGSIMKPYVYASAIDLKMYNGESKFLSGEIEFGDTVIKDYNQTGWGYISYDKGFYHSSNVAIVKLLTDVIKWNDFSDYTQKFGFGRVTNVGLPLEASGKIPYGNSYSMVTSGFGQGMLSTPLQHLQAFSSFLNDGDMLQPQLIHKISNNEETTYNFEKIIAGKPITSETSLKVRELLIGAVEDEASVAKSFRLSNYKVLGKTGTAQIANNLGYIEGENYYSFIGSAYEKESNPKFTMYVGVKNPDSEYSNTNFHTAHIFTSVMSSVLEYDKKIVELDKVKLEPIILDDYIGKERFTAIIDAQQVGLNPIVLGNGDLIINQMEAQGMKVAYGNKILLYTGGTIRMPNIINWSKSEIKLFEKISGIEVRYNGYGYVSNQSIEAGTIIQSGDVLEIVLADYTYKGT